MDELVAFLRDRLDEDEQAARAAHGEVWDQQGGDRADEVWMAGSARGLERSAGLRTPVGRMRTPETAAHVARHDPARVVRDTDAKRQILRHITPELDAGAGGVDSDEFGDELAHWTRLLTVARLFAQPYADHPDYREEWRA